MQTPAVIHLRNRIIIRVKSKIFWTILAAICLAICTCIAAIIGYLRDISYSENEIQRLTELSTKFQPNYFTDLIGWYQGRIPDAWSSIYSFIIVGVIGVFFVIGLVTTSIKLSPAGIRWRFFFFTRSSLWPDITNIVPDADCKNITITVLDHGDFNIFPEYFADSGDLDPYTLIYAFWKTYCEPDTNENTCPVITTYKSSRNQLQDLNGPQNFLDFPDTTQISPPSTIGFSGLNHVLNRYGFHKVQFCPRCGSPDAREIHLGEDGEDNPLLPLWHPRRCARCGTTYNGRTGMEINRPWVKWERIISVIGIVLLIGVYFIYIY